MSKIKYVEKSFSAANTVIIDQAVDIMAEYEALGFDLSLRQLYYQFVSRDLLENTERSYKNLGRVITKARLAGLIDWDAIVDRGRELQSNSHWGSIASIVRTCAKQFRYDLWEDQPNYVEVWVEKDALRGVLESVCPELDVPYFACKGYSSSSAQWRAGQRLEEALANGKTPVIIHLGDHDPSGLDMTSDNQKRLDMFTGWQGVEVRRIALNMYQIEEFEPPPNPTKLSDSRASKYIKEFGYECWELDALDPSDMAELINDEVNSLIDLSRWKAALGRQEEARTELSKIASNLLGGDY